VQRDAILKDARTGSAPTEVLFIGVACSDRAIRDSANRYYGGRREVRPQQYFDLALADGLAAACRVRAVSEPPVASFPGSRCLIYRRNTEHVSDTLTIRYLTVLNLPAVKTLMISAGVFLQTLGFCITHRGRNASILLGYLSIHTALPALALARAFGVGIFAVVPDLPRLVTTYGKIKNPVRRLGARILGASTQWVQQWFDGYIFLAPAMNDAINKRCKPFVIVEGLIDAAVIAPDAPREKAPGKVVMYAGTLHERFGIRTIVEAFQCPELGDVQLWILGNGDYQEHVRRASAAHPNIVYKGAVSRAETLRFERMATLLVNPRPSADELTKYSFPSKTIEYMASGTPLLTTRLEGIPADYSDHLYWFDDESVPAMARRIAEILAQPIEAIETFGAHARTFVLGSKTATMQARKILSLIERASHVGRGGVARE
jgi:glycosyltransferase involved in cell wall biosynthesis